MKHQLTKKNIFILVLCIIVITFCGILINLFVDYNSEPEKYYNYSLLIKYLLKYLLISTSITLIYILFNFKIKK